MYDYRLWDQCNVVQDYLTVYDGGSNTDRVLVRLCGGDAVPDIVSSRDTMLLEFHTSPYDNPFHPVPLSFLPGFELEVQVIFVDERSSASFVLKEKEKCDFYISSYESSSGSLENPKHSLPPNTTCRYHFQAKPNEIVWVAFVKYYAATSEPATNLATSTDVTGPECNVKLLIWNGERGGNGGTSNGGQNGPGGAHEAVSSAKENATLLGEFCKDEVPRLCDHSLLRNGSRHTRPCSMSESYVSTGRHLTLEHELHHGSAFYPVSFVLRYEFVHEASSCNRIFTPSNNPAQINEFQSFGSPRSVFFYGRGGAANLSCVYRFETGPDKRLELSITKAAFGGRSCRSRIDPLVNRWACDKVGVKNHRGQTEEGIAELHLSEYPWQGVRLPRDCLCSNVSERLVFASLSSSQLELSFVVTRMNVTQDYLDFYFEGEYRFISNDQPSTSASGLPDSLQSGGSQSSATTSPHACHGSSRSLSDSPRLSRLQERRLRGTSGEISLRSPPLQPISTVAASSARRAANSEAAARRESTDHLSNINAGVATIDESLGPDGSGSAAEVTRCVNEPWLIEPEDSRLHFLYLKTPGFRLERHNVRDCPTLVDLISGGWNSNATSLPADGQHSRSFVVEFLQHQPGYYVVTWMAISKKLLSGPGDNFFGNALQPAGAPCPYRCPELDACISSVLWCDGVRHCPSGFDEREENCSYRLGVTLLYVAVGAGALGIFLILLLATGCLKYCLYRRRRLQRRTLQKKLPPQASSVSEKQQHSSSKKKVQVLSADHLGSPVTRSNNGTLQDSSSTTAQPRYANATFARIGRYDSLNRHQHLHTPPQPQFRPDDGEDDFVEKYTNDSIC
ncbi:hypothetical protein QAD02_011249 [Eretmocerus hayati]|uniref:Uncharacterized protein n=1 Tax=Eretmocerus hayati TaxID=131215 RepID=A0ACC2NX72_9HYME|nr:hypothetical protein QAD02_011249 [Eretmocerus hayati]